MKNDIENNTVDFSKLRDFIKESNDINKVTKKRRKKIVTIIINIITIFSLIVGGIGIKTIYDYKEDQKETIALQNELSKKKEEINNTVKEEITEVAENVVDPKVKALFDDLLSKNSDTVGWLKLNNTDIDTPIVKYSDNEFYLNHNFNKKYNEVGWTFADYRNNFPNLDTNTIMYGHTYRNSSLAFSSLKHVLDESWLNNEDNYIIEFTTTKKALKFKIFSIYTVENTTDYLKTDMNEKEFELFLKNALDRTVKDFKTEVKYGDKILTLSTCYYNSDFRLVVHAKLMEENHE